MEDYKFHFEILFVQNKVELALNKRNRRNIPTKKWTLGLKKQTPNYLALGETKRQKMRIKIGVRGLSFD